MHLLPPPDLAARLTAPVLDHRHTNRLECPWMAPGDETSAPIPSLTRRGFLAAASMSLLMFGVGVGDEAHAASELTREQGSSLRALTSGVRGQVPLDFWERPRTLKIIRAGAGRELDITYWERGKLVPEGYWQLCSVLRDVRANVMTTIDPVLLDILRAVQGYYDAWGWPNPLTITSGFRTVATNRALSREGSAKNSLHVQGRATDMYVPGVPPRDVSLLGMHMLQGGVGFYPTKGFTHLDTGTVRTWRG